MANQVIVTNTGNVQVALTPPPNVQVQISRAAIGTVSNVPTANFANYAGNVTGANQPNITSLGTLSNLSVSGNSTVNNLVVTGNLAVGNLIANSANYANFAGVANTANSVAGANVTGVVANATFATNAGTSNSATIANSANSVTLANVSGAGNIASINLDGNASNILFGNGAFSAIPVVSNVANANYANFSGTAFSVSGSNVSGEVANAAYANAANTANLATYATTANSVAGANVSGIVANANYSAYANIAATANSVAVANVSGIGNIAVINLDGNASNVLFGNGTFGPESGNLNANYANFAGEAFNVNASNITGTVANANYSAYAGEANIANLATYATTANSVAGANVSGEVANANFASYSNIASSANSVALANVVGIGNIANINLDGSSSNVLFGNGVFAPESTSIANANYANFAGTLINGNSNISIPSANGNIVFGVAGNSDVLKITTTGIVNSIPTSTALNSYVINSYDTGSDAKRIASFKYRGNIATPLSVNPGDTTMRLITLGHNGAALQTSSSASIRGLVDASYTANGANIPLGWSFQVNDTVGGTLNQQKTHNFWANGNVTFANSVFVTDSLSVTGNITGANIITGGIVSATGTITGANIITGNITANGGAYNFSNGTGGATSLFLGGDKTTNSVFNMFDAQFSVTMSNVNTTTGFSPFRFQTYAPTSGEFGPIYFYRSRGNSFANASAVVANDQIMSLNFLVNSNNSQVSAGSFNSTVTYNDNAGNVGSKLDFNAIGTGTTGYLNGQINLLANTTNANHITANTFTGSGANLSNITGANVTGQVANALVASTVYTNAQPNITSTGNLISLNVVDNANVTGTIQQLAPNTITITTNANNNTAYNLTTIYGETSNIQESGQRAIIRSRGNVSTPATVAVNDVGSRDRVYFYNGTTNAIGFASTVTLSNLNSNSNAYSTGASYSISTGNPNGDQGNASASSGLNLLSLRDTGQLLLIPGANSTAGSMLNIINYGQPASLSTAQGITMSKARGNRDANLSVQANDQIGRVVFQAHNGTSFVTNRLPIIRATVDANYTANTANVPAGFQMVTCDNTTSYTHNFYANGNVSFTNFVEASSYSASGNIAGGNLSTGGTLTVNGNTTLGTLSTSTVVDIKGNNATGYVRLNGVAFNVTQDNANGAAGYSPFFFTTYQSNNDYIPASKFYRVKGTQASPGAVDANSMVSLNQYAVYADSGNTYKRVFEEIITVTGNDGAGNVSANLDILTFNTGSNINLQANTYANNVSISSGGFMKLASYTEAALSAITGQIGWMAAVSDSASGGNPNGMIAFWDTTNSRWSYIHDNSAV